MSLAPLPLSSKVTVLRGLGPARAAALQEAGIDTLQDLLWSLPYRYVDRGSLRSLGSLEMRGFEAQEPGLVTVLGTIQDLRQSTTRVQRMALTEVLLADGTGTLRLLWFNQPYLGRSLKVGDRLLVFGTLAGGRHGVEMRGPQFEVMERSGDVGWVQRHLPLYRKLGPLPGRVRQKLVAEALGRVHLGEDWLPLELSKDLPDTLTALRLLHDPPDQSEARDLEEGTTPAHRRLASEELFAFSLGVALRRAGRLQRPGQKVPTSPELRERLRSFLPFHLTGAQRRSFKEIVGDLTSGRVMNRLLQGDVGSGKTLVALLAMAMVAETGGQGALLVPTEVLARQHAASFRRYLGDEAGALQLLLGGMKAAEKRAALARIASGEARYVIGTHALFQESVAFHRLQLVVVDEQHRFGVKQREALKEKGGDPHWLVMSATPIPRSLALAVFGDLDQSVLDELPPGRQPITSKLYSTGTAGRAWEQVRRELAEGRQAFVVSPSIDPSDEGKVQLRDIQAMEALLRGVFPDEAIEVVHGRLKADDMAARMGRFVAGGAKILLATTVIEVGVDVPNATVMVVDHAERFGLSQLHQLRGRVGRGEYRSHFLMISDSESERLQTLVETQDGFRIAQRDLELRGPGEFFGVRQAGLPQFQVADLVRDRDLLLRCREAAGRALAIGLSEAQAGWLKREQVRLKLADVS
ncbi:MAG: ATP-dependent DNA helicase RecG [Geothrix sp.]|uniref:ATP-dependent DNA helicase RecG n=1 Tax=Geothrix sp. TaxID=1962974 RepID=UPI00185A280D|nr:ATP-dependent DNA helicase RecG [Geothrix sp.]NWJ39975.1 ATP-dependent DNA helicase RecG [Geothrix sp.]WIL22014.1 MAG: ATP-dependent DNA helicase RecG [Geothrix sp.]